MFPSHDPRQPENLRWIADALNLFSNPNQTRPRGYQDGLGLRDDIRQASQGRFRGYTLIYILDQIKSRLQSGLQNDTRSRDDNEEFPSHDPLARIFPPF